LTYASITLIYQGIIIFYRFTHRERYLIIDEKKRIRAAKISELILSVQMNLRYKRGNTKEYLISNENEDSQGS